MTKSTFHRVVNYPYFGFVVIIAFCLWILISEYGSASIGGDLGGFVWVSFHFILNPIIGVILTVFLLWVARKQERFQARIISIVSIAFPLFISYIGVTGNIWFIEFLGIKLKY